MENKKHLTGRERPSAFIRQQICPWLNAILCSYALIIFSKKRLVGLMLLLATFNDPTSGWTGLTGVILALVFARLLGLAPELWSQGFLSFNALLCSLGVSWLYSFTWSTAPLYLLLLLLMSTTAVLLTVSLHAIFRNYLALPVLSIPFVILGLGLGLATVFITGHPLTPPIRSVLFCDPAWLPDTVSLYVRAMGNLFFQGSTCSGLLISLAILVESRLSFLLGLLGLTGSLGLLDLLTHGEGASHLGAAGFNSALTAILLGGVLVIPSPTAFLYASLGVAICVFTGTALESLLWGFHIPPMAIPFNATSLLMLYALRFRTVLRSPIVVDFIPGTPEENLEYHLNRLQRSGLGTMISMRLPFLGKWTVTQPPESEPTHQPPWQHAWDFEVTGSDGKIFRNAGLELTDYHAYDLPIMAPADGTVTQVVDDVPDNRIGEFNRERNWGNFVMLWHGGNIYSLLCHLRPGSVAVKPGEIVRQGHLLGRCGNSGRSPVPHLHFHVQLQAQVNAPTCPSEFVRYVEETAEGERFCLRGTPGRGIRLQNFEENNALASLLEFQVGRTFRFEVACGLKTFPETWTVAIDLYSNLHLESDTGAHLNFYIHAGLLTAVRFTGTRQSALYGFFLAASRLPFSGTGLQSEDRLSARYLLHPAAKMLADILTPFGEPVRLATHSRIRREGTDTNTPWQVETHVHLQILGWTMGAACREARLTFSTQGGILGVRVGHHGQVLLEARRIPTEQKP